MVRRLTGLVILLAGLMALSVAAAPSVAAMNRDKLGLFIHWGLYSILADGEWAMERDVIAKADYNRLAAYFKQPKGFSPREWTRLAKTMGARYAVLTTRHHDGFALFDTQTTDFNSVKTAAGRDYVREFVEACRADGLRVGFYYSIMNWQYWSPTAGQFDPAAWDEQVRVTHEALRELMSNYGKIDYLWYDGCCGPGSNDACTMDRLWRVSELNAMVRRLQPDILINDRSALSGDYVTPEQSLAAPPRGQAWESCLTCNGMWGYQASDENWKSAETLFRSLLHCARFGGNLLINIGPRSDGSVPEGCVRELKRLGELIGECPDAIYGSERDAWTEATHEAGVVTKANGRYWLWSLNSTNLDGVATMTPAGGRAYRVTFRSDATPCEWLGGRHGVALSPGGAPVLGDNADRYALPEGAIVPTNAPEAVSADFTLPAGGTWRLDVGYVNAAGFRDTVSKTVTSTAVGERFTVRLPSGKGVYATRLSPVWRKVAPVSWQVADVVPTGAAEARFNEDFVRQAMSADFNVLAKTADFSPVRAENAQCDRSDERVNFNFAVAKPGCGYALARCTVTSDRDQIVQAAYGADWWGRVFVNGEEALPFGSGWKPRPFTLRLKKGANEILVVTHCGSLQHWFTFYTNLPQETEEKENVK